MCDSNQEKYLKPWLEAMRKHNPMLPVNLVDHGLSKKMRLWFKSQPLCTVSSCPKKELGYPIPTRNTAGKAASKFGVTIAMDVDVITQGNFDALFEAFAASGKTFGGCADRWYPWTWQPPENRKGNRHFAIMSGFVIYTKGSPVIADWLEMLLTWDRSVRVDGMGYRSDGMEKFEGFPGVFMVALPCMAFRDDMQAMSQLYRIGHPDVWEMPPMTQWFRMQGGTPDGYLVAHYTGPDGKVMMEEATKEVTNE